MKSNNNCLGRRSVWLQAMCAGLLAVAASQTLAASVTLCAEPYQQALPAGTNVPMWGYRLATDAAACATGAGVGTSSPGPLITVPPTDTTLQVTLVNRLTVPTSIVLAGQAMPTDGAAPMAPVMAADVVGATCIPSPAAASSADSNPRNCRVRSFTGETAPGASRTYTFSNVRPGTYLYQSGTHQQVQVQMGLFGMARHDAATAGQLFAGAGAGYDADVPVVLSEIDPDQHTLIAATLGSADPTTWKAGNNSTLKYAPRFFLVNGRVFAGVDGAGKAATDLPVTAIPGSRVVLRMANAGLMSRSLVLNSGTWKLLTEDGNAYPAPREQASVLLPAGKTSDALLISTAPTNGTTNAGVALFDRRGGTDNADGTGMGGQVARVVQSAPNNAFINPIAAQVANEGTVFALQVQGTAVTSYALTNAPGGMTISNLPASFGAITWPVALGTTLAPGYTVTVTDTGSTASAAFGLRVNHTPTIAQTGPFAVAHGTVTIAAPGVLAGATDPDVGDTLTAVQTLAASSGTLTLNPNGSFTWTGAQPASGTTPVTFSVAARDPYNLQSTPKTVTLNVAANVPPVAANDTYTMPLARVPLLNTVRAINDSLQVAAMTKPVTLLTGNDTDADGTIVTTTVASVVPVPPLTGTISARRINPASPAGCTTNCLTIAPSGGQSQASVTFNANGTYTLVPHATAPLFGLSFPVVGTYEFRYTVRDDQNALSNQAVVRVTVN
jgi:Cadherin-like domain